MGFLDSLLKAIDGLLGPRESANPDEDTGDILTASLTDMVAALGKKNNTVLLNDAFHYQRQIRQVLGEPNKKKELLLQVIIRCQLCIDKMWQDGDAYVLLTDALAIAASDAFLRYMEAYKYLAISAATVIALWKLYTDERGMRTVHRNIGEENYLNIFSGQSLRIPGSSMAQLIPPLEAPVEPWLRGNEAITICSTKSFEEVRDVIKKVYEDAGVD